jgi:hypothetical protein
MLPAGGRNSQLIPPHQQKNHKLDNNSTTAKVKFKKISTDLESVEF